VALSLAWVIPGMSAMKAPRTPFRLDQGIWLEDTDEVLRWDSRMDDLRGLQTPEVMDQPAGLHLAWKNRKCLGLRADVQTCRLAGSPNPRAYHIYLDTFHYATLRWRGAPEWSVEEITTFFKSVYEHLRRHLGDAAFSYPQHAHARGGGREGYLPAIFWELPSLQIGLSADFPPQHIHERWNGPAAAAFGASFHIGITHEPDGYDAIKAEAQSLRMREGEGTRVNFVAW
jgi:hypothetical protein